VVGILFSFRGRITRAELWIGNLAWLAAFAAGGFLALSAMSMGFAAAVWIYVVFCLMGFVSLQALAAKRAHDLGASGWKLFGSIRVLVSRGMAEPNMYGPAPESTRVWRFLGVVILLGIAGYIAAGFGVEKFATSFCTPFVSATGTTKDIAEQNWRQAVRSAHGENFAIGFTVGHTNVCRNNECTVTARACRRP
jgi:uncharacterized membrane protein YhaH (DUF805 family)